MARELSTSQQDFECDFTICSRGARNKIKEPKLSVKVVVVFLSSCQLFHLNEDNWGRVRPKYMTVFITRLAKHLSSMCYFAMMYM